MVTLAKGTWWRQIRRTVATEQFNAAIAASNRWILVGADGGSSPLAYYILQSSATGYPIFYSGNPSGSVPLNDVGYLSGESIVFAVGGSGRVYESSNLGQSWTSHGLTPANDIEGVVCVNGDANSNVIAVGDDTIWGRNGSQVWTTRWTGTDDWKSVAYRLGNGWVAVGDGGMVTQSPSGVNGTFVTPYSITTQNLKRIKANDSYYIAVGANGDIWRSATGLSGSWTQLNLGVTGVTVFAVESLDIISNDWVAAADDGTFWYSDDDGDTWTEGGWQLPDTPRNCGAVLGSALLVGDYGTVYVSYDQTQEDYVSTVVEPTAEAAFAPNADMAGDAVRRLITQFRSGRG